MTATETAHTRRLAHSGQPTPAHIMSAINLLADYCQEHGYPTVTVADTGGAIFHADNILDRHGQALAILAAAEPIGAPSSGVAETAARALHWYMRWLGPNADSPVAVDLAKVGLADLAIASDAANRAWEDAYRRAEGVIDQERADALRHTRNALARAVQAALARWRR